MLTHNWSADEPTHRFVMLIIATMSCMGIKTGHNSLLLGEAIVSRSGGEAASGMGDGRQR